MQLGNFSVSLAVKDIAASLSCYEKLGFRVILGVRVVMDANQRFGWTIKAGAAYIQARN